MRLPLCELVISRTFSCFLKFRMLVFYPVHEKASCFRDIYTLVMSLRWTISVPSTLPKNLSLSISM